MTNLEIAENLHEHLPNATRKLLTSKAYAENNVNNKEEFKNIIKLLFKIQIKGRG